MDLRDFDTPLKSLLNEAGPSLEERLTNALWRDFAPSERSVVMLLDYLDVQRESGRLDPRRGGPEGGTWFPEGFLKDDRPARKRALARWERQGREPAEPRGEVLGKSRLLLLLKHRGVGACAWLSVTAFLPPDGRDESVLFDPGSFFAVREDEHFLALRENLRPAIGTLFDGDVAARAGLERTSFLVEISPLRPADLDPAWHSLPRRSQKRVRLQRRAWSLTQSSLEIKGPSLGLPLGLAAGAALRGRSCNSVLATGELGGDGRVTHVDGLKQKAEVIRQLLGYKAAARRHRCCFVAAADHPYLDEQLAPVPQFKVEGIDRLSKAVNSTYFTDGFDDYRKNYLSRLAERPPEGGGYRKGDASAILRAAGEWLGRLKLWLGGFVSLKTHGEDFRRLLAVPFGADPEMLARYLERGLSRALFPEAPSGRAQAGDLPVIVRASWRDLFGRGQLRGPTLTNKLLDLIHHRSTTHECNEGHLENAFAAKGKLVFVLHDDPSEALWEGERSAANPSAHSAAGADLDALSRGGAIGGRRGQPQVVIVCCSDRHHAAALLSAIPSQQPN